MSRLLSGLALLLIHPIGAWMTWAGPHLTIESMKDPHLRTAHNRRLILQLSVHLRESIREGNQQQRRHRQYVNPECILSLVFFRDVRTTLLLQRVPVLCCTQIQVT
ncbi:hypothetical protein M758_UG051700 [Ceratodon purpureus]|nr:hypothetical protein M758_UG051700 [Ceratodon purpureus]